MIYILCMYGGNTKYNDMSMVWAERKKPPDDHYLASDGLSSEIDIFFSWAAHTNHIIFSLLTYKFHIVST